MRKFVITLVFLSSLYGVEGSVIFYDGTSFEGEIVSVDPYYVYIIPTGLPLPEEILVEYIATLILENGFIIVENSQAIQGYRDDKYIILDDYSFKDPWKSDQFFFESGLDDYYSKSYGDYRKETDITEFKQPKYAYSIPQIVETNNINNYESMKRQPINNRMPLVKSNTYGSVALYGGYPIFQSTSLKWLTNDMDLGQGETAPNLGLSGNIPIKFGPLSGIGIQLMTLGFVGPGAGTSSDIKAMQFAPHLNFNLTSLMSFLPSNMDFGIFSGFSYHIGWSTKYSGAGIIAGGNLDYWLEGQPFGIRFFGQTHIIPGPGTTDEKTADIKGAFGTTGIALITSFALTSR
ncbi:MAG: hypothetical protein CMG62_03355 [Candidatus Marinimicrobia bacterium]|nr:hypothetical protein [Candidatus Neomarinimicrobiota bacterium]